MILNYNVISIFYQIVCGKYVSSLQKIDWFTSIDQVLYWHRHCQCPTHSPPTLLCALTPCYRLVSTFPCPSTNPLNRGSLLCPSTHCQWSRSTVSLTATPAALNPAPLHFRWDPWNLRFVSFLRVFLRDRSSFPLQK